MIKASSSMEIRYAELSELKSVVEKIAAFADDIKVWIFEGQMGAGKTTMIKEICKYFMVEDTVTSPTFSLVNEYRSVNNDTYYHFDFYRIKHESEALDMGVEEYFYSGDHCFVEWPSKIGSFLPSELLEINISVLDGVRSIVITKHIS